MITIKGIADKFRALDTDKIIDDSFLETKDSFIRANVEQLRAGKTKTGESISPRYRSSKYARVKNEMNPVPGFGVPDLILTGSFTQNEDAVLEGDTIKVFSNDSKAPDLEAKYKNIFGLGADYKKDYLETSLGPAINKKISSFIGLQFG